MSTAASPLIRLHEHDNVLVARRLIGLGETLAPFGLRTRAQVPAGHKIAARAIAAGETILKYDTPIGVASRDIEAGEHVHTHNVRHEERAPVPEFSTDVRDPGLLPEAEQASFMGIVRPDGRAATRNFIGLLASVNCSSTVIHKVAEWFTPERLADFPAARCPAMLAIRTSPACS